MNTLPDCKFWNTASRNTRWRINAGIFLQSFFPPLIFLSLAQGCLLLLFRRWEIATPSLWLGFAGALLLAAVGSFWWSRRRFFNRADALVHLEAHLHLHNRLTTAEAGLASWPPPRTLPSSMRWVWPRILLPPTFAILFLALAGWIPVQNTAQAAKQPIDEPIAWQQLESWAELLQEEEVVDEEQADAWREQVEQLRQQSPEEWYSHNSLEAGDNLRDTAADNLRQLQKALDKAAFSVTALQQATLNDMPSGLQPLLQEHWLDAMSQLGTLPLTLDKDLLAQLSAVDFANLQNMSQEQMDRLSKMLREKTNAASTCVGGECDGEGEGECNGSGGSCPIHGNGWSVARGPGAAELSFNEAPSLADAQRREAVSNPDLRNAALGEQLGTTQSAPEVDAQAFTGPVTAGNAVTEGDGGEAVWRSRLTPAEEQKLKTYFQ